MRRDWDAGSGVGGATKMWTPQLTSWLRPEVIDPSGRVAVLAGAGISLDPPSSLLDGRRFVNGILAHAAPKGEPLDLLLSLLDRPTTRLSRPGEYLRFEI